MPRPVRVNAEHTWYHVFNRGISRKTVCFNDYHFQLFCYLLREVTEKYKVQIHAYCMMKNHFHILMYTEQANISKAMWYLGKNFAQAVNADINGDGPLFRNRFRSIVIEDDRYWLQVSRYIHNNPVEAGLCDDPSQYDWSSCQYFLGIPIPLSKNFIVLDDTLKRFRDPEEYRDFLQIGTHLKIRQFYSRKNIPSILSKSTFK